VLSSHLVGVLSGLASALAWGSGDFVGGQAARRITQFQVVALAAVSGLAVFVPAAVLRREPIPNPQSFLWALAAGVSGAFGVAALYAGLAGGSAAVVAPTATVVGAGLPVILSALLTGLPGRAEGAGILLGLVGIWLVTRPSGPIQAVERTTFLLALAAGAGFGGFFILIAQVETGLLFIPLAVAKVAALVLCALVLRARGQPLPSGRRNPQALLAGVLDGGGNLFYLIAAQQSGMAVAPVLSSMAPAVTVLLSVRILHEPLRRAQALGVVVCLAAVGLISL
jgi:drug/metabolite transporter (DMT)-like permease